MSEETRVLLENITADVSDSTFSYGEKHIGAGYHRISGGLHTVVYSLEDFIGTIKIQGTLELYPGELDWIDIPDSKIGGDDTQLNSIFSRNFTGNFVWIRAAYNLQYGSITQIRYNY